MQWNRCIGGILLVAGTTIGAGMLGLPVMTGFMGFFPSVLLFFICWVFMLASGIFFVDINCSLEGETNLVSMAERTLGYWGRALCWAVYLLLLYSLIAAYIGGSAPLFVRVFQSLFHVTLPLTVAKFLLPLLFGPFIYLGTLGVDWINRTLMMGLIIAYICLVFFLPEHIDITYLKHSDWPIFAYAAPVVLTSFGYHIIIPSLGTYLHHNKRDLLFVIISGSLIALIVNILWQLVVLGTIPLEGAFGLKEAWKTGLPATESIAKVLNIPSITIAGFLFSFFAILTSFLGVSLSLSDFLMDGLHIKKTWEGRLIAIALSFIPPLIFVNSYQRGFLLALEYAGAFVAILLVFLPAMMVLHLDRPFYQSLRGKSVVVSAIVFSVLIVFVNILIRLGVFDRYF